VRDGRLDVVALEGAPLALLAEAPRSGLHTKGRGRNTRMCHLSAFHFKSRHLKQ
jgi:hypothetical protein